MGCPHCRVVSGPHDEDCPWHPAADRVREEFEERVSELEAELEASRRWAKRWKTAAGDFKMAAKFAGEALMRLPPGPAQ